MIRILLVDDHTIFRRSLRELVEKEEGLAVAGEAGTGRDAVSKALAGGIDLVLLDISLPDAHGIDVLKQIRQASPDVRVVILTMHPDEQYGVRALKAGAHGYITKDCEAGELASAIRRVYSGGKSISPVLSEILAEDAFRPDEEKPSHEALTDREYQVLKMLGAGMRIQEIADQLGLAPNTVSTYRHQVLKKLDLADNEALYDYVTRYGLLN